MALDRWIALIILPLCGLYGWTAFVPMEAGLLPFELGMPFLPNSLPKGLGVIGAAVALFVLVAPRAEGALEPGGPDLRALARGPVLQALTLLALMAAYALALRPMGFLFSTFFFLVVAAIVLGERRWPRLVLVAALAAFLVWYLVQEVLGVYLRPLPWFA